MPQDAFTTAEELAEVGDEDTVAIAIAACRVQREGKDS
jgi:hypothetical protein